MHFLLCSLLASFFFVSNASASTVTAGNVTSYTENLSVFYTCTTPSDVVIFNPNGVAIGGDLCPVGNESGDFTNRSLSVVDSWIATPNVQGMYTVLFLDVADTCVTSGWDGASDDLTNCLITNPTPSATFSYTVTALPSFSFEVIGSSTASDMIAGVGAGVGVTGAQMWVIAAMALSITLFFYIAGEVMDVILQRRYDKVNGVRHGKGK